MSGNPVNNNLVTQEVKAPDLLDFWLTNLEYIKKIVAQGSNYLSLAAVSTFALAEAISYTLFEKSSRYYFKNVLDIKHSHLMYEAFRNGFTHSFNPNGLYYKNDVYVSWAWSTDTSPSGFRPFYFGEYNSDTGEEYFAPDQVVDYLRYSDKHYQIDITLDRLIARIEADLVVRKEKCTEEDMIKNIVGKRFNGLVPSGSKDVKEILGE